MPTTSSPSSLPTSQAQRIMPMSPSDAMSSSAVQLLTEVEREYEGEMNRKIFEANVINNSNKRSFRQLALPSPPKKTAPPQSGVVDCAEYDFKGSEESFKESTFLTETAAIEAVLAVQAESNKISAILVLPTSHKQSQTLQEFKTEGQSFSGDMFRILKDDWPSQTSKGIRRALANCSRYDLDEGDMRKYKDQEIYSFLSRANKLMTDSLFTVTSNSLEKYSEYITKNCEGEMNV